MDVTARSSTAPRREIQPKRQRRARLHPFPRIPLVCQWKQSPPSSSREVREFQGYKELSDSLRTPSEWGKSVFLLALQEITALANCKLPIMQYYFTWLDCCIQQLVHKSVCVCVCVQQEFSPCSMKTRRVLWCVGNGWDCLIWTVRKKQPGSLLEAWLEISSSLPCKRSEHV